MHCDTKSQNKSHYVLSKFTILCWAAFTAILGCVRAACCRLDTPGTLDIGEGPGKDISGRGNTADEGTEEVKGSGLFKKERK